MVSAATKSSGSDRLLRLDSLGSTIDAFHSRGIALGRSSSCQPLSCSALTTSHRMAKLSSTGWPLWVVCRSCPSVAALSSCRGGSFQAVAQTISLQKQMDYEYFWNSSTRKQRYADCYFFIPPTPCQPLPFPHRCTPFGSHTSLIFTVLARWGQHVSTPSLVDSSLCVATHV